MHELLKCTLIELAEALREESARLKKLVSDPLHIPSASNLLEV